MAQPPAVSLDAARERAVQLLSYQYASDRLSLDEVERRLELAYRARTPAELDALLADLPRDDHARSGERPFHTLAAPGEAERERRLLTVFAEVKRRGAWTPPRALRAVTVFGSTMLDLREARLQPGVTEIEARIVFGELTVIVPPGVRVESEGNAVFGSFDHSAPAWEALPPDAPTVRIRGLAVFGATKVKVRLPGEGAIAALRRRWREGSA
ncbi:MAG TPA: DUF1707 domain-containing protein [Gemmatimonadaceae bacterium]|nr:DUF1707 domain-containing protein [Gemmatimonadaceae bacterium]